MAVYALHRKEEIRSSQYLRISSAQAWQHLNTMTIRSGQVANLLIPREAQYQQTTQQDHDEHRSEQDA